MGVCDPCAFLICYLQKTVAKILAIRVAVDFDGFIQPGSFRKNLVAIRLIPRDDSRSESVDGRERESSDCLMRQCSG